MQLSQITNSLNQIKNRYTTRPACHIYFPQATNFLTPHTQHLCTGSATDMTDGAGGITKTVMVCN